MTTQTAPSKLTRHRFSIEDYHWMAQTGLLAVEQRTELLDGEIYDMSPVNSLHAAAVKRLNRLLSRLLGDAVLLSVQDPIALSGYSEPQPDIAVLQYRANFYAEAHPKPADILLIVEVADSSVFKDRNVKIPMYGTAAIPEVWLVNLENRTVKVFQKPVSGGYETNLVFAKGEVFTSSIGLQIAVDQLL
ncbi:MAG: Uma2 family endonuclease [Saprospiraceae bacterium]